MAQWVKTCLQFRRQQETQVGTQGGEDLLEKEMATHSSILSGEFHGQRSLMGYSPWGHKSQTWLKQLSCHTHDILGAQST